PAFKIRKMKTKWGSCATDHSRIWFNIELAKKPLDCMEYIVVHELVHLLERNHNKRFIALMDQFLPNSRTQKKLLNELPWSVCNKISTVYPIINNSEYKTFGIIECSKKGNNGAAFLAIRNAA